MPKLTSCSYKTANKIIKDKDYAKKRFKTLLIRVLTRIDKITIYLGNDELGDKELKTKISLLSQLLGVKKLVSSEIKELDSKGQNNNPSLRNLSELMKH